MDDDVRAVGEVTGVHGAPVVVGVCRGHVNLDGRMLNQEQMEDLAHLLLRASWLAGHG